MLVFACQVQKNCSITKCSTRMKGRERTFIYNKGQHVLVVFIVTICDIFVKCVFLLLQMRFTQSNAIFNVNIMQYELSITFGRLISVRLDNVSTPILFNAY